MRHLFLIVALGLSACSASNSDVDRGPVFAKTPLPNNSALSYHFSPYTVGGNTQSLTLKIGFRETSRRGGNPVIPVSASRLAAYTDARISGRGMEHALAGIATELARRTYCPEGAIQLAPTGARTHFNPDQFAAVLGSQANYPKPKGRVEQVPPIEANATGGTVRLKCDSPNPYVTPVAALEQQLSAPQLRALASGRTHRSYSKQHGTQVEYLAPDGNAYLWYPGNTRVVAGTWRVEQNDQNPKAGVICYAYRNSHNPALGLRSGEQCITARSFNSGQHDARSGDLFNLRTGHIPYVLPKRDLSFEEL